MTETFIRGSTVTVRTVFRDADGEPVAPSSATVRFAYFAAGRRATESFALVSDGEGGWTYDWDSSVADAGEVAVHVRTDGDPPISSDDTRFTLAANRANPAAA